MSAPNEDLRSRIAGALSYLGSKEAAEAVRAERSLAFAVELLKEADRALGQRDRELEAATDPGIEASKEIVALRNLLERTEEKVVELELSLSVARGEVEALEAVTTEEQRTRRELERRVADIDKKLMTDDDAFTQFMEAALDEEERRGRERGGH